MSGIGANSRKVTKDDLIKADPLAAKAQPSAAQASATAPSNLYKSSQQAEPKSNLEQKINPSIPQATSTETVKPKTSLLSSVQSKVEADTDKVTDFRIMLATMKAYEPLMSAITFKRIGEGRADVVDALVTEVDRLTESLCEISGTDYSDPSAQWMVSQYRKIAADQIGLQWKTFTGPINDFKADTLIASYKAMNDVSKLHPDVQKYPTLTDSLRLQMSCMKAMVPITGEYSYLETYIGTMLSGFSIKKSTYERISTDIFNQAFKFTEEMVTDPSDLKSKMFVMQSSMEQASSIYLNSLNQEVSLFIDHCEKLEFKDKQMHVFNTVKANADVIDLGVVAKKFDQSFNNLTAIIKASPMRFAVSSSYTTPSI